MPSGSSNVAAFVWVIHLSTRFGWAWLTPPPPHAPVSEERTVLCGLASEGAEG